VVTKLISHLACGILVTSEPSSGEEMGERLMMINSKFLSKKSLMRARMRKRRYYSSYYDAFPVGCYHQEFKAISACGIRLVPIMVGSH